MTRSLRLFLAALSGILLSAAWLGLPGWTLFVAFLPLLYLDYFFVQHKSQYRSVMFWGHAFLAFLVWNTSTTWWIVHATAAGAVMAILANSFLMSLVAWLGHIARRNFASNLGYIALAAFWLSFEYCHFHWDIEWPWLTLGNGFANKVKLIQWYEYTGVFGGSLWVLSVNIILFNVLLFFAKKQQRKKLIIASAALILLVTVPVVFSLFKYSSYQENGPQKNITIVQPNIDPYSEDFDLPAERKKLQTFKMLAAGSSDENTDFIIGPETLFENPGFWNENQLHSNTMLQQLSGFLRQYPKAEMVFGVSSFKPYESKENAPPTARTRNNMTYDLYNTALFVNRHADVQIYHKSILVVGVEKMPFMKYFGFLGDWVINIGGTSSSLGRQNEPTNFISADSTEIAPVICYESVFGQYVTRYVKDGAGLIFIITNDGWWKNTPGYRQHESFARLRAIETRRSIARAANTGISCFINQRGDVQQQTAWWTEAAISGSIQVNDEITFYVKYGDYIARISVFLSVLLTLFILTRKFTNDSFK